MASILDLGADPTGVADSRSAIQRAITEFPGEPIVIPPGRYRVTGGAFDLSGRTTPLVIRGDNSQPWDARSVLHVREVTDWLLRPTGNPYPIAIEGVAFDGSNGGGSSQASATWMGLLKASEWRGIRVRRCWVKQTNAAGAIALDLGGAWQIDLDDLNLEGFWFGMLLTLGGTSMSVRKVYAHYAQQAIDVGWNTTPLVFRDCIFESCFSVGRAQNARVVFDCCHFEQISWGSWVSGVTDRGDGLGPVDTWFSLARSWVELRDCEVFSTEARGAGMFRLIGQQITAPVFTFMRGGYLRLANLVLGSPTGYYPDLIVTGDAPRTDYEVDLALDASPQALELQRWLGGTLRRADRGWIRLHLSSYDERRAAIERGLLTVYAIEGDTLFPPPPPALMPWVVGDRCVQNHGLYSGCNRSWIVTESHDTATVAPWDLHAAKAIEVESAGSAYPGDHVTIETRYDQRYTGRVESRDGNLITLSGPASTMAGAAGTTVRIYRWQPEQGIP